MSRLSSVLLTAVTQFLSNVRKNIQVAEGYSLLEFDWPVANGPGLPEPGQFITVRNGNSTDPLLRRPFAVSSVNSDAGSCEIIYQIRGKSTQALSACREGDLLDIIGPLGNGFPPPRAGRRPYLLAGGIGFGPIYFFASSLVMRGNNPITIFGARTGSLIPDVSYDKLRDGNGETYFCTDDGSTGVRGTVMDVLRSLDGLAAATAEIYACGPQAMLSRVAAFCEAGGISCWVSVEQVMGCGVGACMGCAIRAREPGKYLRVCTEGPVFNAKDIAW